MNFDAIIRAEAATFCLEVVRLTGMVAVAPLIWTAVPARIKAMVVLTLALAVHGQTPAPRGVLESTELLALATVTEFALGASMGFVTLLVIAIAEMAGNALAPMMGFGVAQVFDPQAHTVHAVLAQHFRTLAVLLAVLTGLHRTLIAAVLTSFQLVPPGTLVNPGVAFPMMLELTGIALVSAIRISMPILAILLLAQLALAFISRAAPAMQIFSVGFAVTLGVGLVVTWLVLPDIGRELIAESSRAGTRLEHLVGRFASPSL
jgi:flagellar biosynthetic protein FliR